MTDVRTYELEQAGRRVDHALAALDRAAGRVDRTAGGSADLEAIADQIRYHRDHLTGIGLDLNIHAARLANGWALEDVDHLEPTE